MPTDDKKYYRNKRREVILNKKFEEPRFEKTEFEAVAYLNGGSNQVGSGNAEAQSYRSTKRLLEAGFGNFRY